ncbi:MAG: Histidine ammonia-lyase [uncultured Pyrinomonadaceae bacterium]|uniref:Histidine ammonia-lyase n=1 Tax=uncultured Pyrinomonadaceae bacterium TaxID=2283094 RepID=A0A6J4ND64_9BACT|nr:MAG: Histidine ammonia-lyase [uncultured Pyrinomonadaceae bacterium]
MNEIILDGESLTFEQVLAVAHGEPNEPRVSLSEKARANVRRSAEAVQFLLKRGEIAYGITTGFGAFKDKIISREEVELLQRNIIVSHAVGVGKPFDIPTTRAIILIRANTLARGFSGIRLETLELLIEFLNRGVNPLIPEKGSLGASGDLAPLAHMACVLIGEGEAILKGEKLSGREALEKAGLQPIMPAAKEGLALTNGTTIMTAVGLLETHKAKRLADIADVSGCLSLEALSGTVSAFDERIHALRPHPRQIESAKNLREILAESEFTRCFDPANCQDAYTLRCMPQVHGACRDAIAYAEWVVNIELNAVTDNPLIFCDENCQNIEVISGGNFHGEPLALSMDYLAIALSELGNISERRLMRLTDENSNAHALPAFLTENGGLNSGFMIVQYTAAALCTENKILAHPASVDTIPSSANVEDHVSMGVTSVLKLRQIAENLESILALELFAAAQGVDFRRKKIGADKRLGRGTQPVYDLIRRRVPFIEKDVYLKNYIEAVREIVASQ